MKTILLLSLILLSTACDWRKSSWGAQNLREGMTIAEAEKALGDVPLTWKDNKATLITKSEDGTKETRHYQMTWKPGMTWGTETRKVDITYINGKVASFSGDGKQ